MSSAPRTTLTHDDTGGPGPLVVMLPGAGDLRSEYRFLAPRIAAAGFRVVTADLPGHGESALAERYTVESTADALLGLLRTLGGGPAVVVATSFAPAAAVWAAAREEPGAPIAGIVSISPHFHADDSLRGRLLRVALRVLLGGPWAGAIWSKLYAGWYKSSRPDDLSVELGKLRKTLSDPARRRAVAKTLTAGREGVAERMGRIRVPTLTVFGSADDHFPDPAAEAASTAKQLGGTRIVVEGAGHYPHVEQPERVASAIREFLEHLH